MSQISSPCITRKIIVNGMVQGVGFRPHLYRLATGHGLHGEVANSLAGLELILEGDRQAISLVVDSLRSQPPAGAVVTSVKQQPLAHQGYQAFSITQSRQQSTSLAPLAPADFGMCPACEQELQDPDNPRYQHAFISCTACGPRFSLIDALPYDRPLTSMATFPLCPFCHEEYTDPASRRFHAEPICCPNCGPQLCLYDKKGRHRHNPLAKAATLVKAGCLLAIKGIGGFHLAADACNDEAVCRLRSLKGRADKPLAIMVRDLHQAAALAHLSPEARDLLGSPMRPIVIMPVKSKAPLSALVAPAIREVGIMLAYTPLHHLLFDQGPPALVMTSFNEPGSPMLTATKEALRRIGTHCDAVLSHDRKIINRCDDSVLRSHKGETMLLRRSRGYAPLPVELANELPPILACGAGEKVTICLTRGKMAFFSQHLGENRSPAGQDHYRQAASQLQALLRISPQLIAHDLHPGYYSSHFAQEHAGVAKIAVQHHHAHIASCMAENGLDHPVLGLALDGTGLGSDGTLWGGEVLLCTLANFRRLAHFQPMAMAGGEAAIKEPWRLALAWLHREGLHHKKLAFLQNIPANTRKMLIEMLSQKVNCPLTSSLGRIFDAVAALINLRGQITYSAQAAMELEALVDPDEQGAYPFRLRPGQHQDPQVMETGTLLQGIIEDLEQGLAAGRIAGRFHNTIISMLTSTCLEAAREQGLNEVVCSGGVFQNRIISQGLQRSLGQAGLTVHCHHKVPCNDGGLALGQAAVAAALSRQGSPPSPCLAVSTDA